MANLTCMFPIFFIQGDGVSTTFVIALKTTPLLFDRFTVQNFPKDVDAVDILSARDSTNTDVTVQVRVNHSGSAVTLTFLTPFTDQWSIQLRFQFIGG
jgi:hypothetical protein